MEACNDATLPGNSERSSGATCQASSQHNAKRYDLLASEFEKCQKSVFKRHTSPSISGCSGLTSPKSSQRGWDVSVRASDLQRVLRRASIHRCHLSADR